MSEVATPTRRVDTTAKDDPILPGPPIEIHVWYDPALEQHTIDPRGLLSVPEIQAIAAACRPKGPETELTIKIVEVLLRFDWKPVADWLDEGRHLHVRMQRPARIEGGR